jgi:phytoene dehydrogenase-like protein
VNAVAADGLAPESLVAEARARTRLFDFGDESFRPALDALVASLDAEAGLSAQGRGLVRERLTGSLEVRLGLEDHCRRHPAILDEAVRAPVVVVGLPRTGTTLLHRLLACDRRFHHAAWWETRFPLPLPDEGPRAERRIARAQAEVARMVAAMPALLAIHPLDATAADEELLLLEHSFQSTMPESYAHVPGYARWLAAQDQTPAYLYLRRLLQLLQWQQRRRGVVAERWVLKTPHHLHHLDLLFRVFPDARVILTHRDPVETIPSLASFVHALRGLHAARPDPVETGRHWSAKMAASLARAMALRDAMPPERFVDVRFEDTVARPLAVVEDVYRALGLPRSDEARRAMRVWLDANPRDARAPHGYAPETFGLTRAGLARDFAAYRARHVGREAAPVGSPAAPGRLAACPPGVDRFRAPIAPAYDAVVVGAGVGGLVAAALLARAGRSVLLVDGHYVAGGNATAFRRRRWEFDVGVHYLGDCQPGGLIPRILEACGADVRFRPMDADLERMIFPDFEFAIPRDRSAFRERLLARFPEEAAGIRRYVRFLEQVDRVVAVQAGVSRWRQLLALARAPLVLRYARRSLGELLDSCTRDPRLRAVIAAQHGTYAVAPSRVSALLHAGLQNHYFASGGWYPAGGGQALADALAHAVEDAGGAVRLRTRATRIVELGGRVTGVVLDSRHLGPVAVRTPLVVSAADLKRTVLELVGPEHFPAAFVERVRSFEMPLPLFVVYLGLDVPPSWLPYGNVNRWLFDDYDFDAAYARAARGELETQPFIYVATASKKDPDNRRIAPPGHTNLQVMTIVPADPAFWGVDEAQVRDGSYARSEGYRWVKSEVTRRVLAQAERLIPGLAAHVVFQESATPLTHTRFTGSTGGTSYGIAATPAQVLDARPGASTPIAGLVLAGASTRSGHGIAGAMTSGVHAADRVLRDGTAARVLGPAGRRRRDDAPAAPRHAGGSKSHPFSRNRSSS